MIEKQQGSAWAVALKGIALIVFAMLSVSASAQTFKQQKVEGLSGIAGFVATSIGVSNNQWVLTTGLDNLSLTFIDKDSFKSKKLLLPKLSGAGELVGSVTDNVAGLLLSNQTNRNYSLCRVKVNLAKELITEVDTIFNLELGKKDNLFHWYAQSPSKCYTTAVYVLQNDKTNFFESRMVLFDKEMNVVWEHVYDVDMMNSVIVTDSGEVITFGSEVVNGSLNDTLHCQFMVSNSDVYNSYNVYLPLHGQEELMLSQYVDGRIMLTGVYQTKEKRKITEVGLSSMVFNTSTMSWENVTRQPFTDFQKSVLDNKDIDKKHSISIDMLDISHSKSTPMGFVLAARLYYEVTTTADDDVETEYNYGGTLLTMIDHSGAIKWQLPIRNSISTQNDLFAGSYYLSYLAGKVVFIQCEPASSPEQYAPDAKVKHSTVALLTKVKQAMYCVDEGGTVTKTVSKAERRNYLLNLYTESNDNTLLFATGFLTKFNLTTVDFGNKN